MFLATLLFIFSASPAVAATTYTSTVAINSGRTSLLNITVEKYNTRTQWSYSNNKLTTPKSLSYSYWTLPPTWFVSSTQNWSYYTTGSAGGTGLAIYRGNFVFGVPTPWGGIGASNSVTQNITVKSNGGYSWSVY
jgi:hypothetical protein